MIQSLNPHKQQLLPPFPQRLAAVLRQIGCYPNAGQGFLSTGSLSGGMYVFEKDEVGAEDWPTLKEEVA
jgi:hypothetical protein